MQITRIANEFWELSALSRALICADRIVEFVKAFEEPNNSPESIFNAQGKQSYHTNLPIGVEPLRWWDEVKREMIESEPREPTDRDAHSTFDYNSKYTHKTDFIRVRYLFAAGAHSAHSDNDYRKPIKLCHSVHLTELVHWLSKPRCHLNENCIQMKWWWFRLRCHSDNSSTIS